jgi:hypothetical protein
VRKLVLAVSAAAMLMCARVAHGDEPDDAQRAEALRAEAGQAMALGQYAEACSKLITSQSLAPTADTEADLTRCWELAFKAASTGSAAPPAAAPPAAVKAPASDGPRPGAAQRWTGLGIGAAGTAGVVAGLIEAFIARSQWSSATARCEMGFCPPSAIQLQASARSVAIASEITLAVGAAGIATGAIVYLTAPRSSSSARPSVALAATANGPGVLLVGQF